MALRYEAWTLPWSGDFKRVVAKLPVPPGSGRGSKIFLSTAEEGSIELNPDQFSRVGEVISDTVGSTVRVFDGTTVIHEWLAERNTRASDDVDRALGIAGPGLKGAFDKAFIYSFDYPLNPSLIQDHIWAGKNVLSDPGFEEAGEVQEVYQIDLDEATGGTFTLTVGGDTTGSINFNASASSIETELQALTGTPPVLDVVVEDTEDGYRIEFVSPASLDTNMTWTPSLTGGGGGPTLTVSQEGGVEPSNAWTTSQNADQSSDPNEHGSYASDGFRLTTGAEPVRTGTYALRINGLSQYSGAQQVVAVEPGMTYQASVWVWSSDATENFKLVIRDIYGKEIVHTTSGTAGSTWTQLTVEVLVPTDRDAVIFRIAQINPGNPLPFYVDDAELLEGQAAATPGTILAVLLDDATTDHSGDDRGITLDWVDYSSFSATLDSGGNAWTASHSFTARWGESYGQVLDKIVDLGYEWDLVPKATPAGGLTHDLVVYNSGGLDNDPSTAITIRQGVIGGDVVKRIPSYTAVVVEGADGAYVEVEDATAVANFGHIEKFFAARHLADTASLTQYANELLAAEAANRTAVRFEIQETPIHPRPLITYQPGDTLPMQMPPLLAKEERRVQRIDYVNTFPTGYIVTGSRVLAGEAAAMELLRRLWRRFTRPEKERRSGALALTSGGGAQPTYTVALRGAHPNSQAHSHIQLEPTATGARGQAVLTTALEQLAGGGKLVLTEGRLLLPAGSVLTIPDGIDIEGFGVGPTLVDDSGGALGWTFVGTSGMRHLRITTECGGG